MRTNGTNPLQDGEVEKQNVEEGKPQAVRKGKDIQRIRSK